jgi:hypothetical protein
MKNLAIITIFLAFATLSAAAQQPVKSQPANPAEPATVASDKPMLQPIPESLNTNRALPPADLKKTAEDLSEHQRGEIEQHNQQLKERFTALQQAGGWQRVFLKQLALQRLELPKATLQLNAAQQFITNFVFCERPLIADETSDFQTFTNSFRRGTRSAEFALEPRASIIINGCSFGPETGEVKLILNHDANSSVPLQVSDWSDSSIFATLGANPGVSDQDAQLVVIRKDGTQSIPMAVEFFQYRAARVFNVPGHLGDLRIAAGHHLTE